MYDYVHAEPDELIWDRTNLCSVNSTCSYGTGQILTRIAFTRNRANCSPIISLLLFLERQYFVLVCLIALVAWYFVLIPVPYCANWSKNGLVSLFTKFCSLKFETIFLGAQIHPGGDASIRPVSCVSRERMA